MKKLILTAGLLGISALAMAQSGVGTGTTEQSDNSSYGTQNNTSREPYNLKSNSDSSTHNKKKTKKEQQRMEEHKNKKDMSPSSNTTSPSTPTYP